MTNILFDLVDVLGEVEPGDTVRIWPPRVTRNPEGQTVVTRPENINVGAGPVTRDISPGPLWVQIQAGGYTDTEPKLVRVPEAGEFPDTVTIANLLARVEHYDPVLESWAYENAERAEQAALDAIAARDRSESEAELSKDSAAVSVAAAIGMEALAKQVKWDQPDLVLNQDLNDLTRQGGYVSRTWGVTTTLKNRPADSRAWHGPKIHVHTQSTGRIVQVWWAVAPSSPPACWVRTRGATADSWSDWYEVAIATPGSHTHDDRYYLRSEVDSALSDAVTGAVNDAATYTDAAAKKAQDYTDASFAASAPGGADDTAIDAAIDRAWLGGRIAKPAFLTPAQFGAVGDGIADDEPAITSMFSKAGEDGFPVALDTNANYRIMRSIRIPEGITVIANGSKITMGRSIDYQAVSVASKVHIVGHLHINTYPDTKTRGVSLSGDDITIDSMEVQNEMGGAGAGNGRQSGCTITGKRVVVNRLRVIGHDWPVNFIGAEGVRLSNLYVEDYVRGVWIRDSKNIRISGLLRGASRNSGNLPGHNGVLIDATIPDATNNLHFDGLVVEDSGEHGIRIGGSSRVSRVRFDHCIVRNVGGSGFKALGAADYMAETAHDDLIFTGCIVEDAGQTEANAAAFTLHKVRNVQVIGPVVRRVHKEYSAGCGVELQGAKSVRVSDPIIDSPRLGCIVVYDIRGDVEDVRIDGGSLMGAPAVYIDRSRNSGVLLQDIDITGYRTDSAPIVAVGSKATVQRVFLECSVGPARPVGDVSRIRADLSGPTDLSVDFSRGSKWTDPDGVIYMRGDNQWLLAN